MLTQYKNALFSKDTENQWSVLLTIFLTLLLVIKSLKFNFPIQDPFHYGEFLAAAVSLIKGANLGSLPYTIHGGSDFFPALVINSLVQTEGVSIAYTVLSYRLFSSLAIIFIVLAAQRYAHIFQIKPYLLIPFIFFAGLGVGWRDLFFCLNMYFFTFILSSTEKTDRRRLIEQVFFGAILALGVFWSFDRGIVSVAIFGLPLLALAIIQRSHLAAIVSFLAFFIFFGNALPGVSLPHHLENFWLLLETSSKWRYEFDFERIKLIAISLAINFSAIVLCIRFLLINRPGFNKTLLLTSLILTSLAFMKIGLNRIDWNHVHTSLWPPILLLTLLTSKKQSSKIKVNITALLLIGLVSIVGYYLLRKHHDLFILSSSLLLAGLILLPHYFRSKIIIVGMGLCLSVYALTGRQIERAVVNHEYDWVLSLSTLPSDSEAVTDKVRWVAAQLSLADTHCVFDMVNNGLINAVAQLPACSQFTYPIYAGSQHEDRLIADLRKQAPTAIVYKGDYWSYSIDGKAMAERYPKLDKEILSIYPIEHCAYSYCIRTAQHLPQRQTN